MVYPVTLPCDSHYKSCTFKKSENQLHNTCVDIDKM